MPSGTKKGQGTGTSPKKDSDSRNLRSSTSKAKKQRHQEQHNSLVSLSSPVKNRPNWKKLLPVRENTSSKKQAPLPPLLEDSPKRERENITPVVTATKQSKESSEEEDSTGSESSVIQAKTSTSSGTSTTNTLPNISGSDSKLEYVLQH